jgi:alpha-galactosidase
MVYHEPTRRAFLRGAAALGSTMIPLSQAGGIGAGGAPARQASSVGGEILRQPDAVTAYGGLDSPFPLSRQNHAWSRSGILVELESGPSGNEQSVRLTSPATALSHLHLRWSVQVPAELRCLGDAWERSYGDLEWRGIVPDRVMPWYCLTFDGHVLRGYGVKTQPAAFCFWQVDQEGISLWADIRNGGLPLQLGQRNLEVATIISRTGEPGETTFVAAHAFCRSMCAAPRLPSEPLYGSNDWYYAYGQNTAEGILRDADLVAGVAPSSGSRPFVTIDDGWQDAKRFPNLTDLAARIRSRGLRPGIWIRPLRAPSDANPTLLLPDARFGSHAQHASPAWDPTIPEAMERVLDTVRQPVSWGYEFIKHDYSTFELLGRWGSSMGPSPVEGSWQFADRSRTNAEIVLGLYRALREAAGEKTVLLGCNTVGHLSAGLFESQRIGDDTSGTIWERTRRMGVNTLGLRLPQHRAFFCVDPDCVALTTDVDWQKTRQWLDVVSRSGVSLFISPGPGAVGPDQIAALRDAFLLARDSHGYAEDWLDTTVPEQWRFDSGGSQAVRYDWSGATGSFPFPV